MYLVIGSTNILGAHTICTLLQKGLPVRAVKSDRSDMERFRKIMGYYFSDSDNLYDEIDWVDADPFDRESVAEILLDIDVVFNCSTPAFFGLKKDDNIINDIVTCTSILVDEARAAGVKYFCHISNLQALGDEPELKEITEKSPRDPKGHYTEYSKASFLSEMEVWRAFEEGLPGSILNAGFVIGPGDFAKDSSAIVARINRGFNFYAKGVTGFIGVNDLVRCMLSITKQNIVKERFIVVSQCMSFADLLFTIADTLGVKRPKFHVCKSMLFCLKLWYRIKYLFTHRNPRLNDDFISLITDFKLYSNEKSINTIVAGYEPIEQVVKDVCGVFSNAKM